MENRMGTQLWAAKKAHKGIGGKGYDKLTVKSIKDSTAYYGLVIRKHPNSAEDPE